MCRLEYRKLFSGVSAWFRGNGLRGRVFGAALALLIAAAALAAPRTAFAQFDATEVYFFDANGTVPGFGSPSGTYALSASDWTLDLTGVAAPAAYSNSNNSQVEFGVFSSDLANSTFSVNLTTQTGGFIVNSASANITLIGTTSSAEIQGTSIVWNVAAGSTLTDDATGTINALNFNNTALLLTGGGTINFATQIGANNKAASNNVASVITENDFGAGLTVNIEASNQTATPFTEGFNLASGVLNFTTSAATGTSSTTGAFSGFTSGAQFTIGGGVNPIIDNTSGSAQTLSLGAGTYNIAGNFTYAGSSSSLSFGTAAVTLATSPTITVAANTLTIGGSISGAYGLTSAGNGTLSLTGASTYTGPTAASSGTLSLGGSITSTTLSVGPAGTLNLSGTVPAATNLTNNGIANLSNTSGTTLATLNGSGALNLTGDPLTVTSGGTYSGPIGSTGSLRVAGGSLALSGANSFSGATAVSSGGTLALSGAGALSGTSGLSVAGGGTFSYSPTSPGTPLAIGGAGSTLNLANNSTIQTAISNDGTTVSTIGVSGSAAVGGNVFLNLTGTPTAGTPYTVLTAAAGLSAGTYYPVNTDYTYTLHGSTPSTDTAIVVTPTSVVSALTAEYWVGGFSAAPAVWAVSDGSATSNWSSTDPSISATATPLLPGSTATIYFNATETNQTSMTLGSSMSVAGIVVNDSNPVGLVADGNTLTIGSGGISVNNASATVTIGSAISLGANQTWTNNSANTLTVSGSIGGTGGITTAGTGTITLTGANTFTGGTNVAGSTTLIVGNSLALQDSIVNIVGTLSFNSSISGAATFGDITGTGNLTLSNGASPVTLTVGGANDSSTPGYSGTLSGAGGLTKVGTGTLILSGANTYGGTTTLSGGELNVGSTAALGNSSLILFNGGTLQYSSSNSKDYSALFSIAANQQYSVDTGGVGTYNATTGAITNPVIWATNLASPNGSLTKSGAGVLELTANSGVATQPSESYSGATIVTGGVLIFANPATAPISGNDASVTNTTSIAISQGATFEYYVPGGNLTLESGPNSPLTISGDGTLAIAANNSSSMVQLGYYAKVNYDLGAGALIHVISGGFYADPDGAAVWTGNLASVKVESGATFNADSGSAIIDALDGSGTFEGGWQARGAVYETIGINNDARDEGTATFDGTIQNYQSGLNLLKVGTGTQILAGSNSYTGYTTVSGGTLQIGGLNPTLKGSISNSSAITVNSGALLSLVNTNATGSGSGTAGSYTINGGTISDDSGGTETINGNLTLNGGTLTSTNNNLLNTNQTYGSFAFSTSSDQVVVGGTAESTIASAIALNGTQTFNVASTGAPGGIDLLVSGKLSSGGISKLGSGTISLANSTNSFTSLAINQGQVIFSPGTLGTGVTTFTGNSTLTWATGNTSDPSASGNLLISNGVTATFNTNGNAVTLGTTFVGASSTAGVILDDTAATPGTLTISAANNYTGGTTITAGTLRLTGAGTIGTGSLAVSGNLDLGGTSQSATNFSGASTGTITNSGSQLSTLSVGTGTGSGTFSGVISDGNNQVALTKNGAGTITLGGLNTYSGATSIYAGGLVLSSAAGLGNTAINVAAGASFSAHPGSGIMQIGSTATANVGASLTLNSGSGSTPGATFDMLDGSIGKVNLQQGSGFSGPALTLGGSGTNAPSLSFELGNTTSDQLNITGSVSVGTSGATLSFDPLASDTSLAGSYTIMTAPSGGLGSGITLATTTVNAGGQAYNLSLASSTSTQEILTATLSITQFPAVAYWTGNQNANWNYINGTSTNWASDAGGATDTQQMPGTSTDVFFTETSGASNLNTSLGQIMTINSLNFTSSAGAVSISGSTLTIEAAGTANNAAGSGVTVASGSAAQTINSAVTLAASQKWTNNSVNTLTVNGAIGDSGSGYTLTTAGTGVIALTGSNTYGGGTIISSGTLNINADAALGAVPGSPATSLTFSGNGTLQAGGALSLSANRNIAIGSGVTATFDTNSNSMTIPGVISGIDSGSNLVKIGNGTLTLSGTNTYAGTTTISVGTLQVGNGGSTGSIASTSIADNAALTYDLTGTQGFAGVISGGGAVNLTGTAAMTFSGNNGYTGGTNIQAGSLDLTNATNTLAPTGAVTLSGTGQLLLGSSAATTTQTLTGLSASSTTASLVGGGNGTTSLLALNIPNGTTDVFAGTLGGSGSNQNQVTITVGGGGTFEITGADTLNQPTVNAGSALQIGDGVSNNGSISTGITDNGSVIFAVDSATAVTYGQVVSGTGGTFTKAGPGTLSLTNNNTYTGATYIQNGTLGLGGGATARLPAGTVVTLGSATTSGVLSLGTSSTNSVTQTLDGVYTTGLGGSVVGGYTSTSTLTLSIPTATTDTFSGPFGGAGTNQNNLALIVAGPGKFAANAASTYTGGTTITGTLLVGNSTGTATGTGAVGVSSGGTLGVTTASGTVGPTGGNFVTVASGGALSVVNGLTLTVGNGLTLTSGAIIDASLTGAPSGISGTTGMITVVGGTFSAPGNYTVNLSGTPTAGTYDLLNYSATSNYNLTGSYFGIGTTPSSVFSYSVVNYTNAQTDTYELDLVVSSNLTWTGANSDGSSNSSWDTTAGSTNWANTTSSPVASQYADGASVTFADTNPIYGTPITATDVIVQSNGVQPGSLTFTNSIVSYTIDSSGSTLGINGTTGITLNGSQSVTLIGANTYTGTTTLNAGTLIVSNNNSLGGPTAALTFNGGTMQYTTGLASNSAGTDISVRTVTIDPNGATIDINGNNVTFANSIGSNGGGALTVASTAGGGVLTLQGAANSFTGLNVNGGTVNFNSLGNLGNAGTISLNGGGLQWATSAGSVDITSGSYSVSLGANGGTFDINGNSVSLANAIAGTGGLTLINSGSAASLTLAGGYSYPGTTNVYGSTLRMTNSSPTGTGQVNIYSGATLAGGGLSGPGVISGSVDVAAGATLAPGGGGTSSPGTVGGEFSVGGLSLNSGATTASQLNYQVANSSSLDSIVVNGALTLPTSVTTPIQMNFYQPGSTDPYDFSTSIGTYALMTYQTINEGGSNLDSMFSIAVGSVPAGDTATFSTTSTSGPGTLELVISSSGGNWIGPSGGNYSAGGNWSGAVPNAAGVKATFADGNGLSETTVYVNGPETVGVLNFTSTAGNVYSLYASTTADGFTLDNSGAGAKVNVGAGVSAYLYTSLALADSLGTTTFTIGSGGYLQIGGNLDNNMGLTGTGQAVILTGGGTLELGNTITPAGTINTYDGGTTVMEGSTLLVDDGSTIGSGGLTITGSGSTATFYATNTAASIAGSLELDSGSTLNMNGTGSLTVSGQPKLNGGSINVNYGTLAFTNTVAASGTGAVTVNVSQGATLQLAGSASALTSATTVINQSSAAGSTGGLQVTNGSQTVGVVTGTATVVNSATTYNGDTVVSGGANLTATQILQNTLTINAGSTVTIAPAVVVEDAQPATAASTAVATTSDATASGDSSSSDPFTAIQAAIAAGSISSAKGQQLDARIAAIESLAATNPKLDASFLEGRVLATIPSASILSSADSSPSTVVGSSLLALDSSVIGSGSALGSATAAFAPSATFAGSPAAVPEPSSLLLAALGCIGLVLAASRRRAMLRGTGRRSSVA